MHPNSEPNPKSKPLAPHQKALAWAALVSVAAFAIPYGRLILLPVLYLNTHLHELCHALAAVITGGHPAEIRVFRDGSGVTPVSFSSHLSALIIASAGYLGATLLGGVFMVVAKSEQRATLLLRILGVALAGSMLIWVRGDLVGVLAGLFWIAILFAAASYLKGAGLLFVAQFIALQQCLNAVNSLMDLFVLTRGGSRQNDAMLMQNLTGIPSVAWASLWILAGGAILWATARQAWKRDPGRTLG